MKRKLDRDITKRANINLTMKFDQVFDCHAINQLIIWWKNIGKKKTNKNENKFNLFRLAYGQQ